VAYKVWTANADRHNDWTTELIRKDGKVIRMNEPLDLSAEEVKSLEAEGRVIEDSSAEKAKEYQESREGFVQMPGADIAGSAPVFSNAGASRFNQVSEADTANVDQAPSQSQSQRPSGGSGSSEK